MAISWIMSVSPREPAGACRRGAALRSMLIAALWFAMWATAPPDLSAGYVTFGDGWGSKWDDPEHGTGAIVTWGFMPDGTTIDPSVPIAGEIAGGSDITSMREAFDAEYGAGAFLAAIKSALATWEAAGDIAFVGPVADPQPGDPLPSGAAGAIRPDIRIGAFHPVPGSGFQFVGAVGWGPPGYDDLFPDPLSGDIMFNLSAIFFRAEGEEDDPFHQWGNDLEGLMLHELGHAAIGLGHPDEGPGDVMYVGFDGLGFINRQLSPDDIAGAQVVYGPPVARLPGDAQEDGWVDVADYTIWADNYLQAADRAWHDGDFNRDGFVDSADFTLWADNYAPAPNLALVAVPEPSSSALAAVGVVFMLAACGGRRRRRRTA